MVAYSIPSVVQDELDRLDTLAGCTGPLYPGTWMNQGNNYEVAANEVHENLLLQNGKFVGIHHPANGVAVDNLVVRDVAVLSSFKWASRSYELRSNVTFEDVSMIGVEKEHGIYCTLIGEGTSEFLIRSDHSLLLNRVRGEYIGSQALQITGPRHLRGQQVGTAPNGTGFTFEQADTQGPPIKLKDNFYRMCCIWGDRPAYALSFRESRHNVHVVGCALDNRQAGAAGIRPFGGLLLQGSTDFRRSGHFERVVVLQPVARYTMGMFDRPHHLTLKNCAFFSDGGQPLLVNQPTGRVRITGCLGNVRVVADGVDAGSIEDEIEL